MGKINNIVIKKLWEDNELFEFSITCSSSIISATTHIYVSKQKVRHLCDQLEQFCANKLESFEWASGMFGDDTTACVSFSFSRVDVLGHIVIEVAMELDDGAPFSTHNCCFYIQTELGLIYSFFTRLPILFEKDSDNTTVSLNA